MGVRKRTRKASWRMNRVEPDKVEEEYSNWRPTSVMARKEKALFEKLKEALYG